MKRILTTLVLLIATLSAAQPHIYNGSNAYPSKILFTTDGKHIYSGANAYPSKILLTLDGTFPFLLIPIL